MKSLHDGSVVGVAQLRPARRCTLSLTSMSSRMVPSVAALLASVPLGDDLANGVNGVRQNL
jgi:hypothetical protein